MIALEDQKKTTFITPWGSFFYRVMLFGLMNAYASFQRWMNWIFGPYLGKSLRVLMNAFFIYSSHRLHVEKVNEVFGGLDADGGQLNPSKCKVARIRIILLGHEVSSNGILLDPRKV